MNRRCPPPAGQQRAVDVEAAKARRIQDRARQQQAIRRDHRDIGIQRCEVGLNRCILQRDRRPHRNAQLFCTSLDGGGSQRLATSRATGGLAICRHDVMPGLHQRIEGRDGEIGSAHENDPHRRSVAAWQGGMQAPMSQRMASPEIDMLTQALSRLPGLGPRSARRAVLHLLKKRETALKPLLAALGAVDDRLATCSVCGNIDTSDPCSICTDPRRDARSLCVVEEVADLWALDRSRLFPGKFHVLGGRLSALEGVRPEDLAIDGLVRRLSAGGIDEVVLAMNATLEGQTTAHYVAERIEGYPVRVTQLAHGLPVGGELDYLDEGTLAQALRARRPLA